MMTDLFNKEIKVGDLLLYLYTYSSSGVHSQYCAVLGFTPKMIRVSENKYNGDGERKISCRAVVICNDMWGVVGKKDIEAGRRMLIKNKLVPNSDSRVSLLISNPAVIQEIPDSNEDLDL